MRRGLLVYNPAAGGHDRTAQMAALAERARGRGVVLSLLATERPGHATQLVAQGLADGPDLVAVAGGDGTIAEAASALVGSDVPLAVLPAGTTNVIARELGLGRSPEEAAEFLSSTATRTVTTWPAAGRTSLICTGVGFDARVMANVNPTLKRLFGRVGFSLTATYEWARYEFPPIEVTGLDADGGLSPGARRSSSRRTRASTPATRSSRRSPTRGTTSSTSSSSRPGAGSTSSTSTASFPGDGRRSSASGAWSDSR
ncbi:MAG: NAD(+)/NADH kinase [Holophagales bacterium]|nr:NAD(+)/NADH kinase [Holophagales bacterium]